jgi:predicted DNA-binding transcriptional regulator AlpA
MDSIETKDSERLTLDIEEVVHLLGINRSTAYELARCDQLPVPVIRLGRRMVVSRYALETLLSAQHKPSTDRVAQ